LAGEKILERDENFLALWNTLDIGRVNKEILNVEGPAYSFDLEEANDVVFVAAHRWLLEDLTALAVTETERLYVQNGFKFILDLQGTFTGEGSKTFQHDARKYNDANMDRFQGKRFVADWKSTKSELDTMWQERLVDSWQWRDYLAETGADIFVYRGIKRRTRIGDSVETREFYIDRSVQPDLEELHRINVLSTTVQRDALVQLGQVPWPQNRPGGCRAFGRECQYKPDCDSGLKFLPTGALTPNRELSYSRIQSFKLCPERYRRDLLAKQDGLEEEVAGPDAEFGLAIHRGLAEVYRQAYGLPEREKK
jgi:hypothetical protein